MKIKNKWYWLDEDFEWNRYPKNIQTLLKQHCDKSKIKLKIDNKEYIFNFKEKFDLEVKTGDMVTIKNPFLNELEKIERDIKIKKDQRMDKHIHHNMLKEKNIIELFSDSDSDSDSDEEWDH